MARIELKEFDLKLLAANGLRRGRTTGSCATAAVKAALCLLVHGERYHQVNVSLPDDAHYLTVPIQKLSWLDPGSTRAEVFKDGGDDPDNTHGATIFADVRRNCSKMAATTRTTPTERLFLPTCVETVLDDCVFLPALASVLQRNRGFVSRSESLRSIRRHAG